MPEEELFKTEEPQSRSAIAEALIDAAEQIEAGTVHLESTDQEQQVTVPEEPTFEVELERLTDSETGDQRYELEYEIRWTR
ncbi:amphi-Trp domain-containing protein [Haloterrigena alkaliphila]|uniref:Amphi-Trp domain-containing protein n=1 Tax=Haloterrigena alkaliphila TaxID=2816475 RepID=A0A8A2VBG2_9EURY|nr:amphi-Trp domain-containing protein [Haloterrigena alkaliphila]QSW98486.1 amphi-Trp domain-containing protein [Haloterrigena alkaliphila]